MIAKLVDLEKGLHWDSVIERVEFFSNNTINRSMKQIPSKMLFGVGQKGEIVDELGEILKKMQESQGRESLEEIRDEAIEDQIKSHHTMKS